jgi:endonuclease/exonuclease/phosphatase (EEP) superfamily protein YafD
MKRLLPWFLHFVVLLFAVLSLLSFSSVHWTAEVLSNFRVQFLGCALLLWLVAVLSRDLISTLVLLACVALHLIPVAPYLSLPSSSAHAAQAGASTRILSLNLDGAASDVVKVRRLLHTESPDVIVFTELNGPLHRRFLADLNTDWPYRLGPFFENPHEVMILSRVPYVRAMIDRSRRSGNMVRVVRFCPERDDSRTDCFTLIAAHPIRTQAASPHQMWRDATLGVVARHAEKATDGRVVVVGDLNVTPWSPAFQSVQEKGKLTDSGIGRGITPTWMSNNPLFGLWIDHVLIGSCMEVRSRRIGNDVGSDHYPVIADVAVAGNCQL